MERSLTCLHESDFQCTALVSISNSSVSAILQSSSGALFEPREDVELQFATHVLRNVLGIYPVLVLQYIDDVFVAAIVSENAFAQTVSQKDKDEGSDVAVNQRRVTTVNCRHANGKRALDGTKAHFCKGWITIAVAKVGIVVENDDTVLLYILVSFKEGVEKVPQGPTPAFSGIGSLVEFGGIKVQNVARGFASDDLHRTDL